MPGFGLTFGVTASYLALVSLLPLAALLWKAGDAGAAELWREVSSPRALAAFRLTAGAAAAATGFNLVLGLLLAWVLARYRFPGHRLLDAVIDLPFALPTAVAGIALSALFAPTGWVGALIEPLGLKVAYAAPGVAVAMAFTSLPFVVRTIQPVLEDIDPAEEEAAVCLGAADLVIFGRIILPAILPAMLSGAALAFSRAIAEYGAVIFIAGNIPMQTEVATLLTVIRLEEFDYPGAAALSVALLALSFVIFFAVNSLQAWSRRYEAAR